MTQYERMVDGLLYDPGDPEIMAEQVPYQDKLLEFNQLKSSDFEKKQQYASKAPQAVFSGKKAQISSGFRLKFSVSGCILSKYGFFAPVYRVDI